MMNFEATRGRPMPAEELRSLYSSLTASIQELRAGIDTLTSAIRELTSTVRELTSAALNASRMPPENCYVADNHDHPPESNQSTLLNTSDLSSTAGPSLPSPTPHTVSVSDPHVSTSALHAPSSQHLSQFIHGTMSIAPNLPSRSASTGPTRRSPSHRTPKSGLAIPDVPVLLPDGTRRPRNESWRDIVKHWTKGDPLLGLHTALKDWPPEWIRGNRALLATKYFQRSVVAREFLDVHHADEASFLAAYPQAEEGHTALLRAINAVRRQRGDRETRLSHRQRFDGASTPTEGDLAAPTT